MNKNEDIKMLVIGMGEMGKPIFRILNEYYDTYAYDQLNKLFCDTKGLFSVVHICFGHKGNEVEDFKKWVKDYQIRFLKKGGLTIIHSTVAVGVSRELNAVHSPIRGQHKDLEKGIRTFVKFFGGKRASEAAEYFRKTGIKVMIFDKPETTEAMKLFSTEYYRVCIEFAQRVKRYCDKHNLNFSDIYRLANVTYNEGYKKLDYPEYTRPVLEPISGPIRGHCVVPNSQLLKLSE